MQVLIAPYPHALELDVRSLTNITFGPRISDERGPDGSVIILPQCRQLLDIQAKKSFWPIDYNPEERLKKALSTQGFVMIAGFPGERQRSRGAQPGFTRTTEMQGIVAMTKQVDYFENDSFDYLQVKSERVAGTDAPESYGGLSGGGLWRIPVYLNQHHKILAESIFAGIIYWQSSEDNRVRYLRAHGPKTIYKTLPQLLAKAG